MGVGVENGSWFSGPAASGLATAKKYGERMLQITKWAGARMAFVGEGRLLIDPKDADLSQTLRVIRSQWKTLNKEVTHNHIYLLKQIILADMGKGD